MKTHASRPPFIDLGMINPSRSRSGGSMRASRVKSSSLGSLNFSYDSETAAAGSGSSPNFLYSAARNASRLRIESASSALSSIGLLFSAFCLAAFFWPSRGSERPRPCRWRSSLLTVSRAPSNMVAILRLAAANSALALDSPAMAALTIDIRCFSSSAVGFALESLELFAERLASPGVFGVGPACRLRHGRHEPWLRLRPARPPGRGSSRSTARSRSRRSGSEAAWPLGLASVSGGGRKPGVEVVKIAHSGRNNRGGPFRAPRPSPASR